MLIHISHTDLDGYGCQLISTTATKGIQLHNVDYGDILNLIETISITKEDSLLITDINLNKEESKIIDSLQKKIGFQLQLLDHHGTGSKQAELYDWYFLDTTKSGTMLTFEYFESPENLNHFAQTVNAYDLWKEKHPLFNQGKLLNQIVSETRRTFPEELKEEEKEHILTMLFNLSNLLNTGISVAEADMRRMPVERKLFLNGDDDNIELTLHEIKVRFFTDKIMKQEPYDIIKIDGFNTYVFTGLSRIFQIFSNKILTENKEIDIAININEYGYMSLRSRREDLDLGEIAKFYFNKGGHPQAAGGSLGFEKGTKEKDSQKLKDTLKEIIYSKAKKL